MNIRLKNLSIYDIIYLYQKWMFGCEVSNRDMSNDYPEIVG